MRNIVVQMDNLLVAGIFYLFWLFPLRRKVVATAFWGRIYGDNPRFVVEELHEIDPSIDFIWLKRKFAKYEVPSWMRTVQPMAKEASLMEIIKAIYELATARVWIDSSGFPLRCRKRTGQLFVQTYHGGLGIKKIGIDRHGISLRERQKDVESMRIADVLISQSDHLSRLYRTAFLYKGPIYKCGYPKNDIFFVDYSSISKKVNSSLGTENKRLFLYMPTFRDYDDDIDVSVYNLNFQQLKNALDQKFGGDWIVLVKWHPVWASRIQAKMKLDKNVLDVSNYENSQELILTVDAAMTDYSSIIFDAALRRIPCFAFATDYDKYTQHQGVYYGLDELPFPYSQSSEELMAKISSFDMQDYLKRWDDFSFRMGLHETGHASETIAQKIKDFLDGKNVSWN